MVMKCTSSLHWSTKNHKSDFLVIIVMLLDIYYILPIGEPQIMANIIIEQLLTSTHYAKLKVNFVANVVLFIANTILAQCKSKRSL